PIGMPNMPVVGWELRTKGQMTYKFNAKGKLIGYRDRYGNSVAITRVLDANTYAPGELRIVAPDGNYITLNDVSFNNFTQFGWHEGMAKNYFNKITVPGTRAWDITQFYRSETGDIVLHKIKYPTINGARPEETFQTGYTAAFCAPITMETDAIGRQWPMTYDANNRLKTFKLPVYGNGNPLNPTYTYNYNAGNTEFVQPSGKKVTEYYDGGILTQVKDQAGFYNSYKYDDYYNVKEATDAKGQTSYFVYDAFANLLSSQDPKQKLANVKQETVYNSWNDVLSTKDCRGVVTQYVRGSIPGCLTNIIDGNNNTLVTNTYNGDGTLASTSSQGVTTTIGYDGNYRPATITTPDGNATITYYSSDHRIGKPNTVTTRLGTSSFTYDAWGRLTGTTRFDTVSASVTMNIMGYVNQATDVLGRPTTLGRDIIGRVTLVNNPRGDNEHYYFDNDGLLTGVMNGNGKTRNYYYTERGELKEIDFADGTYEQYKFDGNGNQTRRINGMLQTIDYDFDNADNLIKVDYPTGTDTTFSYDNDGRQLNMVDSTGTSSWDYDNADNVTKLTTPQGVMDYVYDVWNRRTKLTEGTAETTRGYSSGRLNTINKSTDGVSTTISYDNYGRVTSKNDGATTTTYGYDPNDRVNSIVHKKSSDNSVLHQEWYSYDYANNLVYKLVNSVGTTYTYDEIDQLKTENQVGGGLSNTYNYDHNGNRTNRISATGTDTYVYDDADKLMSVTRGAATTSYTYDNCGRPTNIGSRTLTWDYEDRLTTYSGNSQAASYGYNGVGSRVTKSGTGGTRTYKRNGVGVTAPVLADGVSSMVPGISEKTGGVTNFIHTDRLGSMKGMSNSAIVTETADYDAFGKVVAHANPTATQKGFASGFGYQEDGESGYKLLGHRSYDPETGRFLSRDRAQSGRNWYAYVDNNPLKGIDADGLKKVVIVVGTGNSDEETFPPRFLLLAKLLYDYLTARGYDVVILYAPTEKQLEHSLRDAEGLIYIGHGFPAGNLMIRTEHSSLGGTNKDMYCPGPSDILKLLHGRKLKFFISFACYMMKDPKAAALWKQVASLLYGFDNLEPHVQDFIDNFDSWKNGYESENDRLPRFWGGAGASVLPPRIFFPLRLPERPKP
ncbi:MAG: RHS repeat-associated core domain-containing protein, partial [Armatimonadota bacterium]